MKNYSYILILLILLASIENVAGDVAEVLSPDVAELSYQTKDPGTCGGLLNDSLKVENKMLQGPEKDSGFYRKVGISPNPVGSDLYLHFYDWPSGKIKLGIYNISGQEVFLKHFTELSSENIIQIDISHVKPGLYILTIESRDISEAFRFVKR